MAVARARLLSTCVALSLAVPGLALAGPAAAAEAAECSAFDADLLQVVKPSTDASLLTLWPGEASAAAESYGFTQDEGVLAAVATRSGGGLVGVWRMYRSGDFVWATDGSDADAFAAQGYSRQFVAFYAGTSDTPCVSPIQRLKKAGMHRMATATEAAGLVKAGWSVDDSAVFYATTGEEAAQPNPAPPVDDDPTDTRFAIAVLPDTQREVISASSTRFADRARWLAANAGQRDLRFAMQVGDLTDWGNVDPAQFDKVSSELKPLEAAMPFAGALGNHDTAAVCAGGSACPGADTTKTVRDTSAYNATFPTSRFPNLTGTFEPGKVDNAYQTFSAGGADWLVLTLELWPRTEAVAWARSVVAANPDRNVIVVTHSYLNSDGSIGQSFGGYGARSPQYVYDNLIKLYPNIKLVLSGHVGQSAARTDTGVNGNKILSLLQTFHSTSNPVRIVEFDTARGTATSEVYAPYTDTTYPAFATSTSGLSFVR